MGRRVTGERGSQAVRLRALSVVDEGDSVIVGNPPAGVFVAVPAVGGVVVRALLAGASLSEATAEAERFTGQAVNVAAFIERLAGLGFLDDADEPATEPRRTAALQ